MLCANSLASIALGDPLPKIGERIYVQKADDPYGELLIKASDSKTSGGLQLRDPGNTVKKAKPVFQTTSTKPKPQVLDYKPRNLKFKGSQVTGRISKPRVSFKQENLTVERADEPVKADFYERVFTETSGDL